MLWIKVVLGADVVAKIRLNDAPVVSGRALECEVVLVDGEISRRHVEVRPRGDHWVVRDLGSRNGVWVGGTRVAGDRELQPGEVVQIRPFEMTLVDDGQQVAGWQTMLGTIATGRYGPARTIEDMEPPQLEAWHLSTLLAFSGQLLDTPDLLERRRRLCRLMLGERFHGEAALLLRIRREDPDAPPELLVEPVTKDGRGAPHISRSLLQAVLARETAVFAINLTDGAAAAKHAVQLSAPLAARLVAVACPLQGTADAAELLYVTLPSACSTSEWLALTMMAAAHYCQAEGVWSARHAAQDQAVLAEEIRRAHEVQARLVPRDFAVGPLDVAFGFVPCQAVGGDYIDAVRTRDEKLLLVAMDVAGKGLDAAMIAASLHTSVHLGAKHGLSLPDLLRSLNRYIIETWDTLTSVTVAATILDPDSGALMSINCGHPTPMIVGRDGAIRELTMFETMPLGFIDMEVEAHADRLLPGDQLVFYSDGLSEMYDEADAMLGVDGLAKILVGMRRGPGGHESATDQVARLHRRLSNYRGQASPSDDVSFILVHSGEYRC